MQGLLKTVSSLSFLEMFVPFLEGPSSVPAPFPFSSLGNHRVLKVTGGTQGSSDGHLITTGRP